MGASASVVDGQDTSSSSREVSFLELPQAMDEAINVLEKFALIIDSSEQAHRYLKYQPGAYFNYDDPVHTTISSLHTSLISCMQLGRALTLVINDFKNLNDIKACFDPALFPVEILDRQLFFQPSIWQSIIHPESGDPPLQDMCLSLQFQFILCTSSLTIPALLESKMHKIQVLAKIPSSSVGSEKNATDELSAISAIYGVQETVRNSLELVEAAFEGDMALVQDLLAKGYHIESCDGRKHTALSEAASQGHLAIVTYLLDQGADPNALSDTQRSPLWRAAFNSHLPIIEVLLQSGANPEYRDKVSMESAYDIANDECKEHLVS